MYKVDVGIIGNMKQFRALETKHVIADSVLRTLAEPLNPRHGELSSLSNRDVATLMASVTIFRLFCSISYMRPSNSILIGLPR